MKRTTHTDLALTAAEGMLEGLLMQMYVMRNELIETCAAIADDVEATSGPVGKVTAARIAERIRVQSAVPASSRMTLRKCKQCSTWMRLGKGAFNKNREFCSDACKLRHHRTTKAARELEALRTALQQTTIRLLDLGHPVETTPTHDGGTR
jgi:hypothetical protein